MVDIIAYSIRRSLEQCFPGIACYATYPPKDSSCFYSSLGADYHKYIIFTQLYCVDNFKIYLYYRNKRTQGVPEFSSCEAGMFFGKSFQPLFKEHIEQLDAADFAQVVSSKLKAHIKNLKGDLT